MILKPSIQACGGQLEVIMGLSARTIPRFLSALLGGFGSQEDAKMSSENQFAVALNRDHVAWLEAPLTSAISMWKKLIG